MTIEFALVLPFILLFLFLITDFGRLFNYLNDMNQIAANGARLAAVNNYPGSSVLRGQGDTSEFRNATGGTHLPGGVSVCVSFPNGGATAVGNPVKVAVSGTFHVVPFLTKAFSKVGLNPNIPITGTSTMRLEQTPTYAAGC